ncbi:hypothetical protein [Streptomyces sp. YIM S03343]
MRAYVKITPDDIKPDSKWILDQGIDTIGVVEHYPWPAGSRFEKTPFELWTPGHRTGTPVPRFATLDEAVAAADRIAEEHARTSNLKPVEAHRETYEGIEFVITRVPATANGKSRRMARYEVTYNGTRVAAPKGDVEVVAARVRGWVDLKRADEEIQPKLIALVDARTSIEGLPGWDDGATPKTGDVAYVWGHGSYRRGLVIKVTRTRATVAYVTASNPTLVHRKADKFAELAIG